MESTLDTIWVLCTTHMCKFRASYLLDHMTGPMAVLGHCHIVPVDTTPAKV